ncbi:probable glycosyl transferase [Lachnospiraceae bacterium KM106-2]|nr:probable glycosyl transferase [Lachnospiraceae bacterium KM106-2]
MLREDYISVVIPAYNCEQYLDRCLESVLNQTYQKLEIILINDGSTDQTDDICRRYAAQDARIMYIKQNNEGVAYTRRKAVQLATGQYVGFVDADDYIDADMYEQMLSYMSEAQLVTSGYTFEEEKIFDLFEPGLYGRDQREYLYENMLLFHNTGSVGISTNLWSKLFITEKLQTVVENTAEDIFVGEDVEILFKYILQCESVYISAICAYHYERNENSVMNSVNKDYLRNINSLYLSLEKEFEQSSYHAILLPKWSQWTWMMIQTTPKFMGWTIAKKKSPIRYLNPFLNLLKGKQVVLYGAGVVGKDYYRLSQKTQGMELVLWVDQKYKKLQQDGWDVQSVEQIGMVDYDYIILAIKDEKNAFKIIRQLHQIGISDSKILWKEPIRLDD